MLDPLPFAPSTAPRDGREFMGVFNTDEGPKFAVTRFEGGRFRREKNGQWFDLTRRQTLHSWGVLGPTIIGPAF